MSGIQSLPSNTGVGFVQNNKPAPKDVTPATTSENVNLSVSIPKDKISIAGKGLLAGSVPAAGIAGVLALSAKAVNGMGDGGLGLGVLIMSAAPAIAGSLTGGVAGALVAPGKPVAGSMAGAVTGAVTSGAIALAITKNPMAAVVGGVVGAVGGALGGAAGSYVAGK